MEELKKILDSAGISKTNQNSIIRYLELLRSRDEATYKHACRVGLLACAFADTLGLPDISPKMMLWAGLLHDIGKALVRPEVLLKTEGFGAEDFKEMEPHVEYGWRLLNKIHEYTAHIIVRHHQYGTNPYPKKLPPLPDFLKPKQVTIDLAGRLLALADYYDALTTRNNDKFRSTTLNKRKLFRDHNMDVLGTIDILEAHGIFNFGVQS